MSAEFYVESIFLKLFEKLLGTVNTNLFCWTQRGFSLNAFGLNHYIQFHITVCFLYHIHKIRTIVVNHRWDRYTPSRNLTENNDISNIRNNVFLFQIRVKSYSLIKIFFSNFSKFGRKFRVSVSLPVKSVGELGKTLFFPVDYPSNTSLYSAGSAKSLTKLSGSTFAAKLKKSE